MSSKWQEGMFIDASKLKSRYVVSDGKSSLEIDLDNIKLYAAATELYEALELCVKEIEALTKACGSGLLTDNALNAANTALSKARGEHK